MAPKLVGLREVIRIASAMLAAHWAFICAALLCFQEASTSAQMPAKYCQKFHIDVALFSVGVMLYFFDCYSAESMEQVARVKKTINARPRSGHESQRFKSDMRTIDCALRWGVAHRLPKVKEVMHACVRRGHGEAAVKVFDQMLEKGPVPDADLINKAVSHAFFQLVAGILSDESIRMDGLRLIEIVRAHGIDMSPTIQNRLLAAWENQLPDSVLEYLLHMRRE
ncbi:unnamed protein product [Prorocentrum cordatum]|uniref:Pentatricopeptide repeat-containing protein n=1 Tax=Prorocentrum cordatum TaxID=2364126 RepID=A0ABN9PTZ2_9DINO|nr:unnamed protein product [Polarella glacialis]